MVRYKCSNRAGPGSAPDEHTRNALVRERFVWDSPTISPILRRGGGVCLMGFFEDRSKDAYDRAAEQGRLKDKKGWF